MAGSTVSSYIDANTKQIADIYIKRAGLTPSAVIRRLWSHIAATGEVPDFGTSDERESRNAFANLMQLRSQIPAGTPLDTMDTAALREALAMRDA